MLATKPNLYSHTPPTTAPNPVSHCLGCHYADFTGKTRFSVDVRESEESFVGTDIGTERRWLGDYELIRGFRADPSGTSNPHHPLLSHGET